MKKSILFYPVFLLALLLLHSCRNDNAKNEIKDPSPYFKTFITGDEKNVLRDINFNLSADEIKKNETSKLYEETPDHLFYEFSFPTDSTAFSEYANIQYFFDENNQLDIITADIYMNDSIQENKLRNNLMDYYTYKYGSLQKDDNEQDVWKGTFTDKKTNQSYYYSVAIKKLEDDYGVSIEYVRE